MALEADLGQYPAISTRDIGTELAQLEQELQQARQQAEENDAALAALEEQRVERQGRLQLARRAEEDLRRRIDEKHDELRRAEAEAAVETYRQSVAERHAAAQRFASAAQTAVEALREYEGAHGGVLNAWQAVVRAGAAKKGRDGRPEDEPEIAAQSFGLLAETVRERTDGDMERDLVEAAARSPMGHDIKKLPGHLQALARERRLAIAQEIRAQRRDDA